MKTGGIMRQSVVFIGSLLLLATMLACATIPQSAAVQDPDLLLPPGALAYAHFSQNTLQFLLPALLAESGSPGNADSSLSQFTDRTTSLSAALMPPATPEAKAYRLYASALGDYPPGLLTFALSFDRSWKRSGKIWRHQPSQLSMQILNTSTLLLGRPDIEAIREIVENPLIAIHPVPTYWKEAWSRDLAVFLPEPVQLISASLGMSDLQLPLTGMLLSASPDTVEPEGNSYAVFLAFKFVSARSALIFSPLARLFFYGMAHKSWPTRASTILDEVNWQIEDTIVSASNIRLSTDELQGLLFMIQ